MKYFYGQSLVELLLAIALASLILPGIAAIIIASNSGKASQKERFYAVTLMKETQEAVRSVREKGWTVFNNNGTFHPVMSGSTWSLVSGQETINGFTREVVISDVYRLNGSIVASEGSLDPSTKKVVINITWSKPLPSSMTSTVYLTRYLDNLSFIQTTLADFTPDIRVNVDLTNNNGGEATLAVNTKAKWCSPELSSATIDLPDGPPVAVDAKSSTVSASIANDVFVATSPTTASSVKLAYIKVSANTDPPDSTLYGTFTLDAGKYSNPSYVPSGINLTNNFTTNDVKYYKSANGKVYALIATNLPDHEVIAVQINDGSADSYQDPVNKIFKYWTFFNTKQYPSDSRSAPNYDHAPYGYGARSVAVLGNRGYVISGGYLYVFDLTNIDSKSASNSLDQIGCRIELDGFDCQPGSGTDRKYSANQTGASWSTTTSPAHNDCSDGGNIELFADNDIFPVKAGASTYIYVAVGAGTNPEFEIVNVTSVPSGSSSPTITSSSCGRISGGNSGWKRISSLDFNSASNTEEASNSVFAKSDGSRAYISSNGGIDGNGDGKADSKQFYILNTSNKSNPQFLSGTTTATSGFYLSNGANGEMYPRRSLTVLNGQRVVLVGKDGITNTNDAQEYQVLDNTNESSPSYCGGVNFDAGFNDLTSVTEADGDNYVYMVTNTMEKQLKIIQGGPDGTYMDTGALESVILDVGYSTAFNSFSATSNVPANTELKYQFAGTDAVNGSCNNAVYNYTGPDGTADTYYPPNGGAIYIGNGSNGYKNPARCFRYKGYFTTTDYNSTPVMEDIIINYSP